MSAKACAHSTPNWLLPSLLSTGTAYILYNIAKKHYCLHTKPIAKSSHSKDDLITNLDSYLIQFEVHEAKSKMVNGIKLISTSKSYEKYPEALDIACNTIKYMTHQLPSLILNKLKEHNTKVVTFHGDPQLQTEDNQTSHQNMNMHRIFNVNIINLMMINQELIQMEDIGMHYQD